MRRSRGRGVWGPKGFTLIEVILSIVILATGIIAVQRVFIGSLAALSVIEHWDQAESLLEGKIWEIKREVKEKGALPPLQSSGILLGQKRVYQYALSVKSLDPENYFTAADMSVSWEILGMRRSMSRSFYLMVPYDQWKISKRV